MSRPFQFKQFSVAHDQCAMKVGTDGVLIGAWTDPEGKRILDIGTGCGLIALMLAQRNPEALIDAVEINEPAAQQATQNFICSPWHDRLRCYHQDIKSYHQSYTYDLIISNPPFFRDSTPAPNLQRHHVRHGELLPLNALAEKVSCMLSASGKFSVILPPQEARQLITIASSFDLYPERILDFIPRINRDTERVLITISRDQKEIHYEELFHYSIGNEWSDGYKRLTKDFYTVL